MRIMVCIDETPFSEEAGRAVRPMATAAHASVHLFQAIVPTASDRAEPYSGSEEEVEGAVEREYEARSAAASERLKRLGEQFEEAPEVAVDLSRDPGGAIIRYAEEHDVDLIAMATHSRDTVPDKKHLGGTAERVALSGVAPVLLVHDPGKERAVSLDALAPGTFVFTADGVELGTIVDATDARFAVRRDGGRRLWLPRESAASLNTGRLSLYWDQARVDEAGAWERGR